MNTFFEKKKLTCFHAYWWIMVFLTLFWCKCLQ